MRDVVLSSRGRTSIERSCLGRSREITRDHPWVSSDQGSSRIERLRKPSKSFDPIRSDARSQSDETQMRDRNLTKPSLACFSLTGGFRAILNTAVEVRTLLKTYILKLTLTFVRHPLIMCTL